MAAPRSVALVTGASRGIGKASALALAEAGFDVAIAARTVVEGDGVDDSETGEGRTIPGSLESTAAEIATHGTRALTVRADLHDWPSLDAAAETVLREWGRIDVLVNNAVDTAGGSMVPFLDLSIDQIETKVHANLLAQLVLIKAVLPAMLDAGGGTIVNVTSHVATNDPPAPVGSGGWGLAYAVSKGGFHRVAGILAVELGGRGIRSYNVDPGFVVTERMAVNAEELGLGAYRGAPPSVPASAIAWLAMSAEAGELNGQTIRAQKLALERGLHSDWRRD